MTIKDIAKLSGYAVGTVSRALNGSPNISPQAKEKILAVVAEQRFQLNSNAKHLKQQSSNGIAVIVRGTQNMLFATILERIQELARERGYALMSYYLDEDGDEVAQGLLASRERKPRGLIFLGTNFEHFRARFGEITLPCVMITNSGVDFDFPNLSSVSTDDERAAEAAIDYLVERGHSQIGVLGGCMGVSDAATARFRGCRRAFARHGMPDDRVEMTRFAMDGGYEAMGRLMDKCPGLTAVFAMSDVQAIGAIRALHDRGLRVPEDVSVMGFDGIDLGGYLTPKLTTVCQDARRMADRGVEILFERIARPGAAVHERVPFSIRPGESTRDLA